MTFFIRISESKEAEAKANEYMNASDGTTRRRKVLNNN